jgi:hypothetical protein
MNAGPLDERPVALCRCVVECQGDRRLVGDLGFDYLADRTSGDLVGLLAGGRDPRVAALVLLAKGAAALPAG